MIMHITRERMLEEIEKIGAKKAAVCEAMGVNRGYLTDKKLSDSPIPDEKLASAAVMLRVPLAYLKGETNYSIPFIVDEYSAAKSIEKERPAVSDKTLPKNCFPYNPTAVRPILGSIPAGYPTLAVQEIIGYASVDVPNPEDCFWLLVKGDSMINAGIQPGDLVLIRTQPTADDGQIVACRVNGDEATLKRFRRQGDSVMLLPENPAYAPRVVPQSDFDSGYAAIIGVAIQALRTL